MLKLFFTVIILFLMATTPVRAEMDAAFSLTLAEYNAVNPKQSNLFERGSALAQGKILDSQNRSVGDIHDIMIDKNGTVVAVQTSLGRLGKGEVDLPLNYSQLAMFPVTGGYKINQTGNKMAEILPQLLADVQTAAGAGSDMLSLKRLIGMSVRSESGTRIGKVEDVAFQYEGARAHSLLVRVNYKAVAGKTVAVPLNAPRYEENGIVLTEAQSQALVEFAK